MRGILDASRLRGRLFYCTAAIVVAVLAARATGPGTTTVADTVYRANGSPASGTILISWGPFTSRENKPVAGGTLTVVIGDGGAVSIPLIPNEGATPAGGFYKAVYKLDDGTTNVEYWTVPIASPTTIAAIRATVVPTSVAAQMASKQYVDSADSLKSNDIEVVHKASTETVTGVKNFTSSPTVPDPTSDAQVANKHYVNQQAAGGNLYVQKSGDTMTGPLTLSADPSAAMQAADKSYVDTQAGSRLARQGDIPTSLGSMRYASRFTGADAGAKIANAMADCPSSGCMVEVDFTGAQAISSDIFSSVTKAIHLVWESATYTLPAANLTIPANLTFGFRQGGMLATANGYAVTMKGTLEAPLAQVVSGPGTFTMAGNARIYVQWYGARGDGTTNDQAAVQAAVTGNPRKEIFFPATNTSGGYSYYIGAPGLKVNDAATVLRGGAGSGAYDSGVRIRFDGGYDGIWLAENCRGCQVENLSIANGTAYASWQSGGPTTFPFTGAGNGLYITAGYFEVRNFSASSFQRNCIEVDGTNINGGQPDIGMLESVSAFGCQGDGIYIHGADSNAIVAIKESAVQNGGSGIRDNSQLGNTHINPHTSSNHRDDGTVAGATAAVTAATRGSNLVTVTTASAHGISAGQWVKMAGNDAGFNGTFQTKSAGATTFTFDQVGANGSTGTLGTVARTSNGDVYANATRTVSDCTIAAGDLGTVSCPSAHFTPVAGTPAISIAGAGVAGGTLVTTFLYLNDSSVGLAAAASTAVANTKATYGGGISGAPYASTTTAAPNLWLNPYQESNQPGGCATGSNLVIGGNYSGNFSSVAPCVLPTTWTNDAGGGTHISGGLTIDSSYVNGQAEFSSPSSVDLVLNNTASPGAIRLFGAGGQAKSYFSPSTGGLVSQQVTLPILSVNTVGSDWGHIYTTGANKIALGFNSSLTNPATPVLELTKAAGISSTTTIDATGFRVSGAAPGGNYLRGDGTNFVASGILGGDLPAPTTSVAGGVKAKTCSGTDKVSAIGTDGIPVCTTDQSGAGGGIIIAEEGTALTARGTLNFIGAAITAADNAGSARTDVTLTQSPAGSASLVGTGRNVSTTAPLAGGGDLSADRTLSIANAAADGATKGAASFAAADFDASAGNISLDYVNGQKATASVAGFLTSGDWTTFNGKQAAIAGNTLAANNFATSINGAGTLAGAQPGFSNLSGTATDGQLGNAYSGVGTPTACSNQVVTDITLARNAAPTIACSTVTSGMTSGTFAPSAHNILSASHGDTTAAGAVRGDGIFAIGATPTWQRLAHSPATGGYFKWNGTDMVASTGAAAGTGACGANNFQTGDNADAAPTCAQPAASNLSDGVTGTGAVVLATSPTLTTPKAAQINDTNGNAYIKSTATASAVDQLTIVNAATANPATIDLQGTGTDANINLQLTPKGSGHTILGGSATDITGPVTKINNTATAGAVGVEAVYGIADSATLGADVAATNVLGSTPGAGLYQAAMYLVVTRAATTSSTLPTGCIKWTDQNNTATVENFNLTASNTGNTLTTVAQGVMVVSSKSAGAIQYATGANCTGGTTFASTGGTTMQYALHVAISRID